MVAYTREMLPAARANLAAVLALVEKGKIRCSESTSRPSGERKSPPDMGEDVVGSPETGTSELF